MSSNIYNELKNQILSKYANYLNSTVAKEYLDKIKNYKRNQAPELILKYLDSSLYYVITPIKIGDKKLEDSIVKMKQKEIQKFDKACMQAKTYKNLLEKMRFVYNLIKNVELQEKVFDIIYNNFTKEDLDPKKIELNFNYSKKSDNYSSQISA